MKALEILKEISTKCETDENFMGYTYDAKKVDKLIQEAIVDIEEAMKPKTCDGCKFRNTVKFVQVESETLECCSVCVRNFYDYYEPKDNA